MTRIGSGLSDPARLSSGDKGSTGGPVTTTSASTSRHVDLAANKAPAAQMPVILAIIAIIALSLVTATYARLFLLRRN